LKPEAAVFLARTVQMTRVTWNLDLNGGLSLEKKQAIGDPSSFYQYFLLNLNAY
jgi:hypothetical protein